MVVNPDKFFCKEAILDKTGRVIIIISAGRFVFAFPESRINMAKARLDVKTAGLTGDGIVGIRCVCNTPVLNVGEFNAVSKITTKIINTALVPIARSHAQHILRSLPIFYHFSRFS